MMKWSPAKRYPFWHFISTNLTNMARQDDSDFDSVANLDIQASMLTSGGWSDQFPMAAISMKNWPFVFSPIREDGCTAEEYIAKEMANRERILAELEKNASSPDGAERLDAFRNLFCDKQNVLHKLTLAVAKWVHSGHQRTQFDYLPAYTQYLFRVRDINKMPEEERPFLVEWNHDIPCVVGTYDTELDILKDQLLINAAASKQNKLKIFDMFKGAVTAVGTGHEPAISERQFRDMCAIPGITTDKGGNSGHGPRHAFLLALINFYYEGRLNFAKHILAPKKYDPDGSGKMIVNPNYIDIAEVALGHFDPMCDVSVVARLMEPKLKKLTQYVKTQDSARAKKIADGAKPENVPDIVSAIEREIVSRGAKGLGDPWSIEEALSWERSKCKFAPQGIRHDPLKEKKVEAFDPKKLDGVIESDRMPDVLRDVLAKFTGVTKDLNSDIDPNADTKAQDKKELLNGVWKLDTNNLFDRMFAECVVGVTQLKEGNPAAFEIVVPQIKELLDSVTSPAFIAAKKEVDADPVTEQKAPAVDETAAK